MITLVMLGTSCMVPTKERNVSAVYLEFKGEGILFDCGEGTQRQMSIAGISRRKVKKIFISHWHGDHVSGLIGLIQTLSGETGHSLEIYGPIGSSARVDHMLQTVCFDNSVEIKVFETEAPAEAVICETDEYSISAINLDHTIPALGYAFVEKDRRRVKLAAVKAAGIPEGPLLGKLQEGTSITYKGKMYNADDLTYIVRGKRVSIVMDTGFTKHAITIAKQADLLICEATYMEKHVDRGDAYKHLTALQAGQIASAAQAKKLVMTHFSQRYTDIQALEEEARSVFPEAYAGYDFMKLKL